MGAPIGPRPDVILREGQRLAEENLRGRDTPGPAIGFSLGGGKNVKVKVGGKKVGDPFHYSGFDSVGVDTRVWKPVENPGDKRAHIHIDAKGPNRSEQFVNTGNPGDDSNTENSRGDILKITREGNRLHFTISRNIDGIDTILFEGTSGSGTSVSLTAGGGGTNPSPNAGKVLKGHQDAAKKLNPEQK